MSAFPHPNLGPRNPDPVVDRRLRRASGVATVVMVGCIVLMTAADIGPRYFSVTSFTIASTSPSGSESPF